MLAKALACTQAAAVAMAMPLAVVSADQPTSGAVVSQCEPRAEMLDYLNTRQHQLLFARGLTFEGELLEIYATSTGDWAIVLTDRDGRACIATHGHDWELIGQPRVAQSPGA